jgi:hypothetical protein
MNRLTKLHIQKIPLYEIENSIYNRNNNDDIGVKLHLTNPIHNFIIAFSSGINYLTNMKIIKKDNISKLFDDIIDMHTLKNTIISNNHVNLLFKDKSISFFEYWDNFILKYKNLNNHHFQDFKNKNHTPLIINSDLNNEKINPTYQFITWYNNHIENGNKLNKKFANHDSIQQLINSINNNNNNGIFSRIELTTMLFKLYEITLRLSLNKNMENGDLMSFNDTKSFNWFKKIEILLKNSVLKNVLLSTLKNEVYQEFLTLFNLSTINMDESITLDNDSFISTYNCIYEK